MPTDSQIATMVEVARTEGLALSRDQQQQLAALIEAGWVADKGGKYALTAKGQSLLDERGVGANES